MPATTTAPTSQQSLDRAPRSRAPRRHKTGGAPPRNTTLTKTKPFSGRGTTPPQPIHNKNKREKMASLQAAASRGVAVDRKAGAAGVVAPALAATTTTSSAKAAAALVAGAAPAPKAVVVSVVEGRFVRLERSRAFKARAIGRTRGALHHSHEHSPLSSSPAPLPLQTPGRLARAHRGRQGPPRRRRVRRRQGRW